MKPQPLHMRSCSQPKCTFSILSSLSVSVQPGQTLCQDVRCTEYGESAVCIYTVRAFSFSLKYIDLDKKYYLNIQGFVYKDILSVDRQNAQNNPGIRVLSCNCVRVAV